MPWCWWWADWYVDWCEPEQLEGRRPASVVQRQFTILRPDTFRPLSPSSHQHHTSASSIKYQLTLHLATSYHKKSFVYFEPTSAQCKVQCENIKICYSGFSSYSDYIFLSFSSSQHILHILRYFCRTWQTDKPVTRSVYPVTRSRDTHNNAGTFRLYFLQIPESEHSQFSAWVLRSTLSFLLEIFRLSRASVLIVDCRTNFITTSGGPTDRGTHLWCGSISRIKMNDCFFFLDPGPLYRERSQKFSNVFIPSILNLGSRILWHLGLVISAGGWRGRRVEDKNQEGWLEVGWRMFCLDQDNWIT